MLKDIKFTVGEIERLFPCGDEDGTDVQTTPRAESLAKAALGIVDTPGNITKLKWHLPDVFSVRYGSSYVASASAGNKRVRFHTYLGDFKEGDDRI